MCEVPLFILCERIQTLLFRLLFAFAVAFAHELNLLYLNLLVEFHCFGHYICCMIRT